MRAFIMDAVGRRCRRHRFLFKFPLRSLRPLMPRFGKFTSRACDASKNEPCRNRTGSSRLEGGHATTTSMALVVGEGYLLSPVLPLQPESS